MGEGRTLVVCPNVRLINLAIKGRKVLSKYTTGTVCPNTGTDYPVPVVMIPV
jgi:hypothetical protein